MALLRVALTQPLQATGRTRFRLCALSGRKSSDALLQPVWFESRVCWMFRKVALTYGYLLSMGIIELSLFSSSVWMLVLIAWSKFGIRLTLFCSLRFALINKLFSVSDCLPVASADTLLLWRSKNPTQEHRIGRYTSTVTIAWFTHPTHDNLLSVRIMYYGA